MQAIYMYSMCTYWAVDAIVFRYDYENCESAPAEKMISDLESYIADASSIGKTYSHGGKTFKVAKADNFEYTDPIDQSVSKKQVRLFSLKRIFILVWYVWLHRHLSS